jgi:hypothetical protein
MPLHGLGHAATSALSQLSGVKQKLDLNTAKGSFWRKADSQLSAATSQHLAA